MGLPTFIGAGHIHGIHAPATATPGTLTLKSADGTAVIASYASPNLQSLKIGQKSTTEEIKNYAGDISSKVYSGQYIECAFDFIPEGATLAGAVLSATIPDSGGSGVTAGMPVIKIGGITDALNASNWLYDSDGTLDLKVDEKGSGSITLRRYPAITSMTAIAT